MKYLTTPLKSKFIPIVLMSSAVALTGCGGGSKSAPTADTIVPVITITGDIAVSINHNETYTDAGANASDNIDGMINIVTSGTVDTAIVGEHILTYTATDAAGNQATSTRTVSVIDVTAPTISLTGDASITIFQNSNFVDQGATATDAVDAVINVVTTGSVNEGVTGEYVLTYTASDAAGNESIKTRTITVTPAILSGTAAGGAAIVGTVVVKGANGNVKSAVIEADGSYEVDVTGLTAPYRLRAVGTVGGKTYKFHSYAEEASVGGTVNITPFTDLIIANTAHQLAENFFDSNVDTSLSVVELDAQEDALQAKLQKVFDALGLDVAIDLLRSSFNADHSGVDAALDLIRIDTGNNNIATITNLLDNSKITDDITDSDDNDTVLEIDNDGVGIAVTDRVAIANLFDAFANDFSGGIPQPEVITDYFSDDFLYEDQSLQQFFTDILTDPNMIGVSFISLSINDLNSDLGTATVSFATAFNGFVDPEVEQWFVAKDEVLGWQIRGDQQIVELSDLGYHCYNDGTDVHAGGCGINTSFEDNDFNNNGIGGNAILSASVSIVSGEDGSVKDTFYIGTAEFSSRGDIYNERDQSYSWDWRAFGTELGQINPSIFSVGDTIEYNLYESNLDLSNLESPAVVGDALVTYSSSVNYEPQTVGKYPTATQETLDNLDNFTLGEDLTITWALAEGTRISEVLVEISTPQGDRVLAIWEEFQGSSATSTTVDAAMFAEELLENDEFDPSGGYTVTIRIYAIDSVTGQEHSTDYHVVVNEPVREIPQATIITDGNINDWQGIEVALEDAEGDSPLGGMDIVALYIAQDTDYLYIRMDRASTEMPIEKAFYSYNILLQSERGSSYQVEFFHAETDPMDSEISHLVYPYTQPQIFDISPPNQSWEDRLFIADINEFDTVSSRYLEVKISKSLLDINSVFYLDFDSSFSIVPNDWGNAEDVDASYDRGDEVIQNKMLFKF